MSNRHTYSKREHALQVCKNGWISQKSIGLHGIFSFCCRNPQFFVQKDHPINGARPFTQQSRGCGEPGDFVALPYSFLTAWNTTWETFGDPAKLFVKEWAKFRYGIFDEHGFKNDLLYPNFFNWNGHLMPTGTADAPVNGQWLNAAGRNRCNPQIDQDCYFFPTGNLFNLFCKFHRPLLYLPNCN